jgi:hypothetical protein
MAYDGAYPLAMLTPSDPVLDALQPKIFAYSRFRPGDLNASALPSVAVTLRVRNTLPHDINMSFFLSAPMAAINNCQRPSQNVLARLTLAQASNCLHACDENAACLSWTYRAGELGCVLAADVPLSVYADDAVCGVAGTWAPNNFGESVFTTRDQRSAAAGQFSISVVGDCDSTAGADDSLDGLWQRFSTGMALPNAGWSVAAATGGVAATSVVASGDEQVVSVVRRCGRVAHACVRACAHVSPACW